MVKGISVIICTYNGKARLAKTLEHLVNQEHSCLLEVVLVANACTDGTQQFADTWWLNNGIDTINYNSYSQPIPGKSFAQELGYEKATYEYLLICDDDNWLAANYVQDAFEIMEAHTEIGGLGGWCEAVFENEKPTWFDTYARYYAVSKQGTQSGDITNKKGCLYGAGMVIRKSHWLELKNVGFVPLLTCRKGDTLSSGGDTEYSYALRLLGYTMWYDERLYFQHFMPQGRLSLSYVKRIRKAMSASNFIVSVYVDAIHKRSIKRKTFFKRAVKMIEKDGIKNILKVVFGSFESKEVAKEYFRTVYRFLFSYPHYCRNRESLHKWVPTKLN